MKNLQNYRGFRNVGIKNSDDGELPRRKHTTKKA